MSTIMLKHTGEILRAESDQVLAVQIPRIVSAVNVCGRDLYSDAINSWMKHLVVGLECPTGVAVAFEVSCVCDEIVWDFRWVADSAWFRCDKSKIRACVNARAQILGEGNG